ncbi:MAG: hypothetical protein DMF14_13920 [Verrucomicrobia bacterium]|nr:MAG: hypothetical protein DMF14_13920 [Verrucomicrobiota bacterium]
MKISPLGDSAITVDFTDESPDRERLLARALSVAETLERANVPGVIDVTSAYESVALFFDPARIERDVEEKIRALVASARIRVSRKRRRIEIPVCYDADFALDLARVEAETNLHPPNLLSRASGLCPGFLFSLGFRKNCGQRAWPLRGRKSPRVRLRLRGPKPESIRLSLRVVGI